MRRTRVDKILALWYYLFAVSLSELTKSSQELLPNLGNLPIDQQRDKLRKIYGAQGLLNPANPDFATLQPMADISGMRRIALSPYVDSTISRMRQGAPLDILAAGVTIDAGSLFETVQASDGQTRPTLFIRHINRSRLELARQTGTDRDGSMPSSGNQYDYEVQAMREYAISSPRDITYSAQYAPTSGEIRVNNHDALLIYAPETLQQIIPRYRYFSSAAVFGLHAFIHQRFINSALLATVENDQPSPHVTNLGGSAIGGLINFPSIK